MTAASAGVGRVKSLTTTLPPVTLDKRLARRLAKAAQTVDDAIAARDALLVEGVEAGASLREMAAVTGLSHVTVKNILDRRKKA